MELSVWDQGQSIDANHVGNLLADATAKSRKLAGELASRYEKLAEDSQLICSLEVLHGGVRNPIRDIGIRLKQAAVEIRQQLERTSGQPLSPAHIVKEDAVA